MHGKELTAGRSEFEESSEIARAAPVGDGSAMEETIQAWFKQLRGRRRRKTLSSSHTGSLESLHSATSVAGIVEEEASAPPPPEAARHDVSPLSAAALSRFHFIDVGFDSAAPFAARAEGKQYVVRLNQAHPAYAFLAELVAGADPREYGPEEFGFRYQRLQEGVRLPDRSVDRARARPKRPAEIPR